ncbi:MAG: phage FluMu protein Com [Pirellulaceae bacterium]|jgi:phage FluMu protein Com
MPGPTAPKIKVACICGQEYLARAELAGKQVRCPSCKEVLTVEKPEPSPDTIHKLASDEQNKRRQESAARYKEDKKRRLIQSYTPYGSHVFFRALSKWYLVALALFVLSLCQKYSAVVYIPLGLLFLIPVVAFYTFFPARCRKCGAKMANVHSRDYRSSYYAYHCRACDEVVVTIVGQAESD